MNKKFILIICLLFSQAFAIPTPQEYPKYMEQFKKSGFVTQVDNKNNIVYVDPDLWYSQSTENKANFSAFFAAYMERYGNKLKFVNIFDAYRGKKIASWMDGIGFRGK